MASYDELRHAEKMVNIAKGVWRLDRRPEPMSDLRKAIDSVKRAMQLQIDEQPGTMFKSDAIVKLISSTLHNYLRQARRDPWRSANICAAYELAADEGYLPVFDGVWNQVEVRGEFKCAKTEMPPELVGRQALRRTD